MSPGVRRVAIAVGVLVVALVGAIAFREVAATNEEAIVVVHWSNSHPMREGLMPAMAEEFNEADHETAAGQPIEVVVVQCDSAAQSADLVERIKGAGTAENGCKADGERAPDPAIVTPQSSDWLVDVNHRAGRDVVDLDATQNIAETWLGIVTYRAMAECLGWPGEQLGYADILALRADQDGWAARPECARTEWGRRPLLAFTNPNTSTSGRNVLVSLYSMAAGKSPVDLTVADIERPEVVEQVKDFQQLVDHYMPTTLSLNTKIAQGVEYGHFFLLPEDNLVSLYMGNEKAIGTDGTEQPLNGVSDLVMIYPEEGSVLNGNPAAIVDASWVTPDHRDGASQWIDYLRDADQQRRFMDRGFRPASGTGLEPDARQFAAWGLDVGQPTSTLEPGDLRPDVLDGIIDSWGSVKNPAIVTFVVDVSGSMSGEKIEAVKEGMFRLIDAMADANNPGNDSSVGLITFESTIVDQVPPAPISESKYDIADVVTRMQATGGTALYDAVELGIEMTDAAPGDERAARALVVLSDGEATEGMCLADIVDVSSNMEVSLSRYCGYQDERPVDDDGNAVDPENLIGIELAGETEHPIQVFFVGFGTADVNIGRVLAQATGAEYQGQTDDDLAAVIEELSGYF